MADFGAIRALAFDLDGTLVDSALARRPPSIWRWKRRACRKRVKNGLALGSATAPTCWCSALRWADAEGTPEQCGRLRERFDHFYAQTVDSGSRLFPQVQETLARLAAHGYPMALVTNKPTLFWRRCWRRWALATISRW